MYVMDIVCEHEIIISEHYELNEDFIALVTSISRSMGFPLSARDGMLCPCIQYRLSVLSDEE